MLLPTATPLPTLTITITTTIPPHRTPHSLAARSAVTLYPSAPAPSSTVTESPQSPTDQPPLPSHFPRPKELPTAFWIVLCCILGLSFLLALSWRFLGHRLHRRNCPHVQNSAPTILPSSEIQQQPREQQQKMSPQWWGYTSPLSQQQQFQMLQAVYAAADNSNLPYPSSSAYHNKDEYPYQHYSHHHHHQHNPSSPTQHRRTDPNTTTLISRLRQLDNPSILGAIPE
ncbi:MAG: hypothetical protein Q9216_005428, partial [Gyalolechia sp. 2 TL-2023]